jgi:cation transport ATPase
VVVVLAGGAAWLAGLRGAADVLWTVATGAGLVPGVAWVVRSLRRRQVGVDLIAVLALAGALVVREYLAGAVVAVMLATGRSLEAYAERRAARDLHALLERAPRSARRRTDQGSVEVVGLDQVRPNDRLLVGPGEVVPVDGRVEEPATLDEAAVTGESRPVDRRPGDSVASGVVNAGPAFGMRATTTATESTYAGTCAWPRMRPSTGRRWYAWPTGTPPGSCRSPCCSPRWPGGCPAARYGRWPSWSSPPRVR